MAKHSYTPYIKLQRKLTKSERKFVVDTLTPLPAAKIKQAIDAWERGEEPTTERGWDRGVHGVCDLVLRKR